MGTIIQIMRGYVHHTNVCIVGLPVVAIFGKQHKQNGRYLTISQKLKSRRAIIADYIYRFSGA